jgi:hypothetical protein
LSHDDIQYCTPKRTKYKEQGPDKTRKKKRNVNGRTTLQPEQKSVKDPPRETKYREKYEKTVNKARKSRLFW